jgi:hypothetical protein
MTPDRIKEYAVGLRAKLERVRTSVGYSNYRPLQDVFGIADDLCELVVALAENQNELASPTAEIALAPPLDEK